MSTPVVDIHIHLQPWEYLKPAARESLSKHRSDIALIRELIEDPGKTIEWMDRSGLERIGIVNYVSPDIMGFPPETNEWAARYCARDRRRLIGFGSVHPRYARDVKAEARRLLDDLGLAGFKVHPPHQGFRANAYRRELPELASLYEVASEARVPVMIHTGTSVFPGARSRLGDPLDADDIAVDFPDLVLLLAHAGRPLWCQEAFFVARRHPNVYLDLSGIPPLKLLECLPRLEEIAPKCLFGTDWPGPGVPSIEANVAAFRGLPVAEAAKALMLRDTANRLFQK
jgi:predicted TIM-barrel fold metal-dependent hydrolase